MDIIFFYMRRITGTRTLFPRQKNKVRVPFSRNHIRCLLFHPGTVVSGMCRYSCMWQDCSSPGKFTFFLEFFSEKLERNCTLGFYLCCVFRGRQQTTKHMFFQVSFGYKAYLMLYEGCF